MIDALIGVAVFIGSSISMLFNALDAVSFIYSLGEFVYGCGQAAADFIRDLFIRRS